MSQPANWDIDQLREELAVVTAERDRLRDRLAQIDREDRPKTKAEALVGNIAFGMGSAIAVTLGVGLLVAAVAAVYAVARFGFGVG